MKFLADFFPVLLFFLVYFIGERNVETARQIADNVLAGVVRDGVIPPDQAAILLATAAAVLAITLQILFSLVTRRRIGIVQWATFAIFLLFGGATVYFHNDVFIRWKPTVLYWMFAVVIFVSQRFFGRLMIRTMMEPGGIKLPEEIWPRINAAWIAFFLIVGVINLVVAFMFPRDVWVTFKSFGLTGLTLLFALGQGIYLARHMEEDPEETGASKPS